MIHAVIMSGGSGTRFWPLSRQSHPKQFLTLQGTRSLLQQASDRVLPWVPMERQWVVTIDSQRDLTVEHLPRLDSAHLLIEPCGRNTAPAIGLAAIHLLHVDPNAVMVVMPADHLIAPETEFQRTMQRAVEIVSQEPQQLVLCGVPPQYPATGFGYIHRGEPLSGNIGFQVASFREKPDRETACRYVDSGDYYWNCGLFVWRADTLLDALARHEPDMHASLMRIAAVLGQPEESAALAQEFTSMNSISIDYAVLERETNVCVVEATFEWDDVGSLEALSRLFSRDKQGNTVIGDALLVDCHNCIVYAVDQPLVTLTGLRDLIVIQTPDATLIAPRDNETAIRELVSRLIKQGRSEI